jgi:hypothetical protein
MVHGAALHGNQCTAGCEKDTNFADESVYLLAANFRNEVVTIHRSQEVLQMLYLYMQLLLPPAEEVLIYNLKLFCRNICNFPKNIFFTQTSLNSLLKK